MRGAKPNPASNCGRIREFFKANPGEELTSFDIAVKFDMSKKEVRICVRELRKQGAIESTPVVYRSAK